MITASRSLAIFLFSLLLLSTALAQTPPFDGQVTTPVVTVTASPARVRYVSMGEVHQTRLQVFSIEGAQVFDSGSRLGNLIDWQLIDQHGTRLTDGSYLYLITIKDFSERLTQKYGSAVLDEEQVYLEQTGIDSLSQAQVAVLEANKQAAALSAVDRIGAAGLNRTSTEISTAGTATTGAPSTGTNQISQPTPGVENLGGGGSQNYLAKWVDDIGTLGNSTLFETALGRVGLGTTTPGARLHVIGTQGSIGAGSFQLDTPTSFGGWAGAYPAFEVVNTNQTNNNVSLFQFSDAPSGASHAGIGAVNTSHANKYGDLFFYTKQPADGYQIRMGIYGGNVGIGTTTPGQKLSVNGVIESMTGGFKFPNGQTQTSPGLPLSGGTMTGTLNLPANGLVVGTNQLALSNGRVGVGTATPSSLFHARGAGTASGGVTGFNEVVGLFEQTTGGIHTALSINSLSAQDSILYFSKGGSAVWGLRNAAASNKFQLRYHVGGANTTILTAQTNGTIGIGNASPLYPLAVSGRGTFLPFLVAEFSNDHTDTGILLNNKASGERAWALLSSGTGSGLGIGTFSINDLIANQTRLVINSSGNVGIGTTTLGASRLTVNGATDATQYNIGSNRVLGNPGLQNIYAGVEAGLNNTGSFNSFVGFGAGRVNTGSANAFFGTSAGLMNLAGGSNSFFGVDAGRVNTGGGNNSFFGRNAGNANTIGSSNTVIGAGANVGSNNLTNATALGAGAVVNTSNTMVLGTNAVAVQVPGSLNVSGNMITSGNMNANNLPGVAFSQTRDVIEIEDHGSTDLNQVTVNVPADGFLFISAFVNLRVANDGSCFQATFMLIRNDHEELVKTTNGSPGEFAGSVRDSQSFHLSWVLPVSAGSVNLKTHVVAESCDSVGAYDRNLSVIYLPKQL